MVEQASSKRSPLPAASHQALSLTQRLLENHTQRQAQRQGIQTTTENSCSQWPKRLTSKLTKNVGSWGAWELR
jgi:hypothetical protein